MLTEHLSPMIPTLFSRPFDSQEHIFEVKWDGIRCLSYVTGNKVRLQSRSLRDITQQFPELSALSEKIEGKNAVVDGELCVLNESGKPDFAGIQKRIRTRKSASIEYLSQQIPATYILWDILYCDGKDMRREGLLKRRRLLTARVKPQPGIIIPSYITGEGNSLFAVIKENNLEGMVAKKIGSPYLHKRSRLWLKIKTFREISCLIGGYLPGPPLSLLAGAYNSSGDLLYLGKIERGLSSSEKELLQKKLPRFIKSTSPFSNYEGQAVWVEPQNVLRIRYLELTPNLRLRHASILGLEPERYPRDCRIDNV